MEQYSFHDNLCNVRDRLASGGEGEREGYQDRHDRHQKLPCHGIALVVAFTQYFGKKAKLCRKLNMKALQAQEHPASSRGPRGAQARRV